MEPKESLNQAEVKYFRIKKDKILTELYFKPGRKSRDVLTFCYGLPSHPFDRFPFGLEGYIAEGYTLAYPHYEGTFGSDGVCTLSNAVNSVLSSIESLSDKNLYDAFTGELIDLTTDRTILVGGSFGGSVALLAAAKSSIRDVISIAAPTDYRTHNRLPGVKEYDLFSLDEELRRAYTNEWRIDLSKWKQFAAGDMDINPIDYLYLLKDKNVLLIHGDKDGAVAFTRSLEFYESLKKGSGNHLLIGLPNKGHMGTFCISDPKIKRQVLNWC